MPQTHHTIIVNGRPRSGKDSAIKFMAGACEAIGYATLMTSSISPVKKMLLAARVDTSRKSEEDRDLLSGVGELLEEHSFFLTKHVALAERAFFSSQGRAVHFVQIREPERIDRYKRFAQHPRISTVLVRSPRGLIVNSNASDRDVEHYSYDHTLNNAGSLEALQAACAQLAQEILNGEK